MSASFYLFLIAKQTKSAYHAIPIKYCAQKMNNLEMRVLSVPDPHQWHCKYQSFLFGILGDLEPYNHCVQTSQELSRKESTAAAFLALLEKFDNMPQIPILSKCQNPDVTWVCLIQTYCFSVLLLPDFFYFCLSKLILIFTIQMKVERFHRYLLSVAKIHCAMKNYMQMGQYH